MLKEIKYLIFILVILLFIFFTGKYYFSDEHKKKSIHWVKNNHGVESVGKFLYKNYDELLNE